MIDLLKLVEQVKDIVKEASKFTRTDSFSITEKEGESWNIVTSADVAVQDFLQQKLQTLIPGSGFEGEEKHMMDIDKEICWIVDPIDGTTNFARGMQQSGISVGMRQGKDLVLGVVYNPDHDDLFWATKGNGAFHNGKRVHVSKMDFEHSVICTALSLYRKNLAEVCSKVLNETYQQCADFRRFGVASLEMCYLAVGRVGLYFEIRLYPWDFAASAVIIREAGGVINTVRWGNGNDELSDDLILDVPSPILIANSRANLEKLGSIVTKHMATLTEADYK